MNVHLAAVCLFALCGLLLGLAACGSTLGTSGGASGGGTVSAAASAPVAAPSGKSERPPVPVEVAVAEVRDVPRRLTALGTTAASAVVVVRPQVSGVITAVHFQEGDAVAAGDVVVELDDRPFAAAEDQALAAVERAKAALIQAEADLTRTRAVLTLAQSENRRTQALDRQAMSSAQQVEQAQGAMEVAAANVAANEAAISSAQSAVRAAESSLAKARLDRSWCRITAPIGGRSGALGLDVGNLAVAQQTPLLTIVRTWPLYVGFSVPADSLAAIRAAEARGTVTATFAPIAGGTVEPGHLDLIENQIDTTTGTIRLRAVLANGEDRLWPGQQGTVELTVGVDRERVTVPAKAVQNGQNGALVWVIAEGTASVRPVTVERMFANRALISSGLKSGETVVTDGHIRLTKGARVTTETGKPSGKGGPKGNATAGSVTAPGSATTSSSATAPSRVTAPGSATATGSASGQPLGGSSPSSTATATAAATAPGSASEVKIPAAKP
jgi:multidrug efflux system membrane fusion protein